MRGYIDVSKSFPRRMWFMTRKCIITGLKMKKFCFRNKEGFFFDLLMMCLTWLCAVMYDFFFFLGEMVVLTCPLERTTGNFPRIQIC